MNRFTTGLITGGVIGAVGLTLALSDNHTKRRIKKSTRKVVDKANDVLSNVTDM